MNTMSLSIPKNDESKGGGVKQMLTALALYGVNNFVTDRHIYTSGIAFPMQLQKA